MKSWEEFKATFHEDYQFVHYGGEMFCAHNRHTTHVASPLTNNKESAMYFVYRELKRELEEQAEKQLLGASDEHIRR